MLNERRFFMFSLNKVHLPVLLLLCIAVQASILCRPEQNTNQPSNVRIVNPASGRYPIPNVPGKRKPNGDDLTFGNTPHFNADDITFKKPGYPSGPFTFDFSTQQAYAMGESVIKWIEEYCIEMGQGNFWERLKDMAQSFVILKQSADQLVKLDRNTSSEMQHAFMQGISARLDKLNLDEFIKKARFAQWQCPIVQELFQFLRLHAKNMANIHPREWPNYQQVHFAEFVAFFGKLGSKIEEELKLSEFFK